MPFEPEQDERKVAAYVGLPAGRRFDLPEALQFGVVIPGAEDYWIVQWGTRVEWDLDRDGPPSEWPSVTFREQHDPDLTDVTPHTYQLWLIQVYRPGHPLAAERRWHPDLGVRDAIVGLEDQAASRPDVLAAWRGHELIVEHLKQEKRERARRSRVAHMGQAVRAARHFLFHPTSPREPTEQDICDFIAAEEGIACPRSTLTTRWRRLEDYGEEIITIDEVRRIAHQ